MLQHKTFSEKVFDSMNYILLTIFSLLCILPFVYVVIASFSTSNSVIPSGFTLDAYKYIFTTNTFVRSLGVSFYITILGTTLSIIATALMAYALSFRDLPGRKWITLGVIFTMLFQGGMIPTYIVVRNLGLIDTYWSLILPGLVSAFYLIIMRGFFQNIPGELIESAKIDGANDVKILLRIVLPLSLPVIAAISMFYAVGIWNQYFNAVMYLNSPEKWPVQVVLRQVVILATGSIGDESAMDADSNIVGQGLKMAVVVVSMLPILIVYPFIQKHFAKGMLLGSVKG
ncbi:carbohydrate ABC transporter permease [Halalkalibacter akibai]|uniref:Probable ABC transporter permease protein ytcP n=1 Tax=Halalkalibacter akibai (strain ATCC 43226 / DSM 21942 / CIP 109018 / JCM 9157 / 1139) TaxID=1236973 RepID=W4QPF4_HALA3|nr:carbohydrate ABC transporter permease [Halalkalibacter akibai]GAE33980.1 probable ABC transporter permease protein ytcP [Halalkalibacter akibai JCM 9157]